MHEEETLIKLGNIEGKLDSLHAMVKLKLDDHEGRLRDAEGNIQIGKGAWAILFAMFTATLYKLFH